MCFDGFLIWISCKQLESCAFRSIWCKQNFLSEIEILNQHFEIEIINIPDKATNQRFQDTTIIITWSPAQVLYLSMPMPFYKKTNWQYMTNRYHLYPQENHLRMVQGKSLSLRMLLTSCRRPKDAAYKLHKAWRRSATLSASLAEILSIPVQLVENQPVFSFNLVFYPSRLKFYTNIIFW